MWGVIKNFRDTVCALQSNCCIGLWQSSEVIPLVRQYTSPSGYPTFRNLSSTPPPFWSLLAILCSAASSAWYWQSFNLQCILINRKKKRFRWFKWDDCGNAVAAEKSFLSFVEWMHCCGGVSSSLYPPRLPVTFQHYCVFTVLPYDVNLKCAAPWHLVKKWACS